MNDFYLVEILFKNERRYFSFPVTFNALFVFLWMINNSKEIICFKVIGDFGPMIEDYFGWGKFNKWVTKFTEDHFNPEIEY